MNKLLFVIQNYFSKILKLFFPMRLWLGDVSLGVIQMDFLAALTGVAVVLPQAIAFALIAGLPPEFGIYGAIIVQIIAALFGSSWHMVSGPTVALAIVIASIIPAYHAAAGTPQYISMSLTLMFLVGVIQVFFSIFRMGNLVNFISHTVIIGFTAGAGALIMVGQMPTFLGITISNNLSFIDKFPEIYHQIANFHLPSISIALTTLITAIIIKKTLPRLPNMLIGMLAGTAVYFLINNGDNEIRVLGALPERLPDFALPKLSFSLVTELFPAAFAIALLGLIEAVSIARSIAIRSQQRIDGNQEFFGQGLSNIIGSCFYCYVGSGSFNRSAINYDSGAKTPLALIFMSIIVFLILIYIPNITLYLPMPAMAGVIMLAGYNLFDFKNISIVARTSRNELTVIVVTFISTLILELEFAIYVGVILSLVFYLQRISRPIIKIFRQPQDSKENNDVEISVIRIEGSLFFASVDHVQNRLHELSKGKKWSNLVIIAEAVNQIDIAGIEFLITQKKNCQSNNGDLYVIALKEHLQRKLRRSPYWEELGGSNNLQESTFIAFRNICKKLNIENYRDYAQIIFKGYNSI